MTSISKRLAIVTSKTVYQAVQIASNLVNMLPKVNSSYFHLNF